MLHPKPTQGDSSWFVHDRFGLFIRTPDLTAGYLVGLTCDGRLSMTSWDGENTDILVNITNLFIVNYWSKHN